MFVIPDLIGNLELCLSVANIFVEIAAKAV